MAVIDNRVMVNKIKHIHPTICLRQKLFTEFLHVNAWPCWKTIYLFIYLFLHDRDYQNIRNGKMN